MSDTYSFEEIRSALKKAIKKDLAYKRYIISFDFPRLLRICQSDRRHKVGDFLPSLAKYYNGTFKEDILKNKSLSKYKKYLSGENILEK